MHGPRAAIVVPDGRVLLSVDADGLHYREAGFLSQDPFINDTLAMYDKTKDPIWKPHCVNCAALFNISVEEAVQLMGQESPKYTFAKNFIYMLLNGGDVPALANAAVSAGLDMQHDEVGKLLHNWLDRAKLFDQWRKGLVREVNRTGAITLFDGRRRRFYDCQLKNGMWIPSKDCMKEIYNFPLIGTEVSYVNPRIRKANELAEASGTWLLIHHAHDGFMLEGPEAELLTFAKELLGYLNEPFIIGGRPFRCPWDAKAGKNWANLGKIKW